jgi:hypothetical protein
MEEDSDTPRTVIQGLMNAADTNETDRPVRKRKRLTRTPDVEGRLSRSLPSTEIRLHQQDQDEAIPQYVMFVLLLLLKSFGLALTARGPRTS